jgi:hypothetical protein
MSLFPRDSIIMPCKGIHRHNGREIIRISGQADLLPAFCMGGRPGRASGAWIAGVMSGTPTIRGGASAQAGAWRITSGYKATCLWRHRRHDGADKRGYAIPPALFLCLISNGIEKGWQYAEHYSNVYKPTGKH